MLNDKTLNLNYKCKTSSKVWQGRKVDTNKYYVKNPDNNELETIGLAELNRRFKSIKGNIGQKFRARIKREASSDMTSKGITL